MVREPFPCHALNSSDLLDVVKPFARIIFIGVFPIVKKLYQCARVDAL